MPEPVASQGLIAAASDALSADRTRVRAMLREGRERVGERARETVRDRLGVVLPGKAPQPPRPSAATLRALPRLTPDWPVQIRLQNGRKVRATVTPAVARRHDLAALGRASAANDRQALAAINRQSDALETLRQSHEELSKKVAALQEQADHALSTLLQGLASLNEQLRTVTVKAQASRAESLAVRKLATRQRRELQSLATTARIQQVTGVVNSVQAAAYGQKDSILATNNLLLAGNQLLWILIDPLLRSFGIGDGASPSLATWLSPLGSLVTGHLALGNRQHVRFISGVARFDGTTLVVREPLRNRIASGLWPEFQRRTDVPATAVPLDPLGGLSPTATVQGGVLQIALPGIFALGGANPIGRVAWTVDTGADVG